MSFMKRSVQTLAATAAIVGAATAFGAPVYLENFETQPAQQPAFSSDHKYVPGPASSVVGSDPIGPLFKLLEQAYTVDTDPSLWNPYWAPFTAHGGQGNMMIINAARADANCTVNVFKSPEIPSLPAGNYELSYWVALTYGDNPPLLQASVNGRDINIPYDAANAAVGSWTQVKVPFALTAGKAQIALCDARTAYQGDDYALDDIAVTPVLGDFCGPASYDSAEVQTTGQFSDRRRGNDINADNCQLNLTGSVGSAGDLWITLVAPPGITPAPTFSCVDMSADVQIHRFDNRKAVGFVSNYDPAKRTGLFFGVYDNGNSDALTISTFNEATGKLTDVKTFPLGSQVKENVWYQLDVTACNDGTTTMKLSDEAGTKTIGQTALTSLPSEISEIGQIGIAGYAKSSFVDSSVRNFEFE